MPKKDAGVQITIRVTQSVVDDAEKLVPMMAKITGLPGTRADVLRSALMRGIEDMKREWKTKR